MFFHDKQKNNQKNSEKEKNDQKNNDTEEVDKSIVLVDNKYNDIKKLEERDDAEEEMDEDRKRGGIYSNLFYLLISFLFIVIFITELDLTVQQKVSQLTTTLFDGLVFDFKYQNRRQDVAKVPEVHQYLKDGLLPLIYNEISKHNTPDFKLRFENTT